MELLMWFCELHIIESFTTDMMLEMYIICLLTECSDDQGT